MANPSDRSFGIIAETTPATLPATGVLLGVDYTPGRRPTYTADSLTASNLRANRSSAGARRVNFRGGGGWNFQLKRDAAIELMLASVVSGSFTANVLKASNVDSFFSIEERLIEGAGSLYQRFLGCMGVSFTVACTFNGNADAAVDIIGMNRQTATTATALTYAPSSTRTPLTGLDVSNIVVGGLTLHDFMELNFAVRHTRDAQGRFGSASARGIGTSGIREVTLSLRGYRKDFSPETVIGDTPITVSFDIGTGVNGYNIQLPAAYGSLPSDEDQGSNATVLLNFTGAFDTTAATDLVITRLV